MRSLGCLEKGDHRHEEESHEEVRTERPICPEEVDPDDESQRPPRRARLFVIDGGKELRKAIRTVFGAWALVHRCHVHELRNVAEEETLMLILLGVSGALHRTLCSTSPIENLIGNVKVVSRNVKRWRGGRMAVCWAVTGLVEASKRFRRIRGHREMLQLLAALDAARAANGVDTKEKVA
jgi:hypothetical protein